jgi:hypothetical protein
MRRDGPGLFNLPGDYDDFTRDELNEVADVIVPHAMRATAELIRYFYSRVDDSPPVVKVAGTSADAERPTRIAIPASASAVQFVAAALAADPTSGVDLDGFEFLVERETDGGFETVLVTDPAAVLLTPLASGTYRVTATVENGGGLAGQSPAGYVEVLPRLTADFDSDADVDGDDLLRLLVGFGAASPVHANGDADRDGDVDRSDLFSWRAELGAITGLAAVLGARATVPEPTSLRLFAVAVLFALGRRLSRRR